jgi:hypothetical protein
VGLRNIVCGIACGIEPFMGLKTPIIHGTDFMSDTTPLSVVNNNFQRDTHENAPLSPCNYHLATTVPRALPERSMAPKKLFQSTISVRNVLQPSARSSGTFSGSELASALSESKSAIGLNRTSNRTQSDQSNSFKHQSDPNGRMLTH